MKYGQLRKNIEDKKGDVTVYLETIEDIPNSLSIGQLKCRSLPAIEFDPTLDDNCAHTSHPLPAADMSHAYQSSQTHVFAEVTGDGNCAGYATLLGLQSLGRIPAE